MAQKSLTTPSAGPKRDKDMGNEVNNLGGFRPGQRLPASNRPVIRSTEILIIARRPSAPRTQPWYRKPLVSFR